MYTGRYRPRVLQQLIGSKQKRAAQFLEDSIREGKPIQSVLLVGQSGLGKTTVARMYARLVICDSPVEGEYGLEPCEECRGCKSKYSIEEINCSADTGIDVIRSKVSSMVMMPLESEYKVYIFDEVHGLTKPAQNALLKPLEDAPEKVVFILCTTEENGVIKTLRSRCQEFKFDVPSQKEMGLLVSSILKKEERDYDKDLILEIISASNGNVRNLVQMAEQSKVGLAGSDEDEEAYSVARLLFSGATTQELIAACNSVSSYTTEAMRMCAYAAKVASGSNTSSKNMQLATNIIILFGDGLPSTGVPKYSFLKRVLESTRQT